jgi:ABC-2 type transport system ATP-binding protein
MSDLAISTSRLQKHYRKVRAVDGLDLRVPQGSIYGFLGRNGAGKTTTIRMMMGLVHPTSGSTTVLNLRWPDDQLGILQRVGYVGERKNLFDSMTGNDLVRFNRGFFPAWSDELAAKYARRLEVPMDRRFKKLSLGNRTKLCLLIALAQGAELLILDEPTSGLDPVITDQLLKVLIEDYASEGRTIFLSSHNLAEVEKIADWVGIIDGGKLLLEARLDDIRTHYRRITATGNALPSGRTEQVVSVIRSGAVNEYVLRQDAERFAAELRGQGATILDVSPLNLSEVFLQLVRKEETCITGNAGEIIESVSSGI